MVHVNESLPTVVDQNPELLLDAVWILRKKRKEGESIDSLSLTQKLVEIRGEMALPVKKKEVRKLVFDRETDVAIPYTYTKYAHHKQSLRKGAGKGSIRPPQKVIEGLWELIASDGSIQDLQDITPFLVKEKLKRLSHTIKEAKRYIHQSSQISTILRGCYLWNYTKEEEKEILELLSLLEEVWEEKKSDLFPQNDGNKERKNSLYNSLELQMALKILGFSPSVVTLFAKKSGDHPRYNQVMKVLCEDLGLPPFRVEDLEVCRYGKVAKVF